MFSGPEVVPGWRMRTRWYLPAAAGAFSLSVVALALVLSLHPDPFETLTGLAGAVVLVGALIVFLEARDRRCVSRFYSSRSGSEVRDSAVAAFAVSGHVLLDEEKAQWFSAVVYKLAWRVDRGRASAQIWAYGPRSRVVLRPPSGADLDEVGAICRGFESRDGASKT